MNRKASKKSRDSDAHFFAINIGEPSTEYTEHCRDLKLQERETKARLEGEQDRAAIEKKLNLENVELCNCSSMIEFILDHGAFDDQLNVSGFLRLKLE